MPAMFTRSLGIGGLFVASGVLLLQACNSDAIAVHPPVGGGSSQGGATVANAGVGAVAGTAGAAGSAPLAQGGAASGAAGVAGVLDAGGSAGLADVAGASGSGGVGGASGAGGSGGSAGQGGGSAGSGGAPVVMLDDTLRMRVTAGAVPLQAWYNTNTGLFDENDWWTSGNQLTTIIDYTRETGDMKYIADIDNTFQVNKASNFSRYGFFDDDGWWALVWIDAYDLTNKQAYLDMAKTIFTRMSGSWDTKCNGGIYWRGNPKDQKNAITNSLFMKAAVGLHQRTPGDMGAGSYLDWAQRTWTWFKGTGMLGSNNLVIDALDGLTTCKATGPTFSYNQGILVGALVELAASTGDTTLLDQAGAIAQASMTSTTLNDANGIMAEPCGIDTKDCWQFKGIFFRNLLEYYRARPATDIQVYTRKQSDKIWSVAKNAKDQFGYEWDVAFDGAAARRQSSALDALITAYAVSSPLP
jgi:predicted alpha-1,6-mannanase (GH76 family)